MSILLVDNSPIIRAGVQTILETFADLELVGLAHDEDAAIECNELSSPKVVLLNSITLSQDTCQALIRRLSQAGPSLQPRTLMMISDWGYAATEWADGTPDGYVLMQAEPREFAAAVVMVAAGYSVSAPAGPPRAKIVVRRRGSHARRLSQSSASLDVLTHRELEVLNALAHGWTNAQIAERLVLSESTVKSHVQNLLTKLRLPNRSSAVALAYQAGALKVNPF